MRTSNIIVIALAILACDPSASPEHVELRAGTTTDTTESGDTTDTTESGDTTDETTDTTTGEPQLFTGCCQCLTDGEQWAAQCNTGLCGGGKWCPAGEMVENCFYDPDAPLGFELACPQFACP